MFDYLTKRFSEKKFRQWLWIILIPLSHLWALVTFFRRIKHERNITAVSETHRDSSRPFQILVGNIHSGGSGKTPLTVALAEHYVSQTPSIVTRGYLGRRENDNVELDLNHPQGPEEFGDEPWMMAHRTGARVFVGKNRNLSLSLARNTAGPKLILPKLVLIDDGFQNFFLSPQVRVLVVSGDKDPQQSHCLPFGELREPLSALPFADAVVLVEGKHELKWKEILQDLKCETKTYPARVTITGIMQEGKFVQPNSTQKWGAFCGIANPDRFFRDAEATCQAIKLASFPDHHFYSAFEVEHLIQHMKAHGLSALLTTEKDYFKVAGQLKGVSLGYLRIDLELAPSFWDFLNTRMQVA